ncbi:MAG TPA: Ig-like domain-containing protein [Thermoanaerobaculia bacterium]|nr:Ig-like domain-containing protein [Thermoanaerobaculia bacterium]
MSLRPSLAARIAFAVISTVAFLAASPAAAQLAFFTVPPCRVYDSRGTDGPLDMGQTFTAQTGTDGIQVAGVCEVPADADAAAFNVTIVGATESGGLVVFQAGQVPPTAGALAFNAGRTRSMFEIVELGNNGTCTGCVDALATVTPPSNPGPDQYQLILDVTGYFLLSEPPAAVDDHYDTEKDTVLVVNAASGVTSNDTLNGASIVSYGATTGTEQTTIGAATPTSAGGSITLNADGSFSYTPPSGAVLIDDTFKYVIQNPSGSSTATVTISVGKASQTISFTSTAPSDAKVGGPTYEVTATATSGLAVTFTIDASASAVCSISGSTVSFIGVGTCVINANQAGDANYQPAPQEQQSFAVSKGDQTITFTSTAPSDATVGGPTYNVTATASSGLTVALTIDASASTVCSISGSTVSFIGVGTCVINANQAGDANYNPAPQVQQSFAVGKGSQTITFTSTAPSDATVNGPTYNVTATASSGLPVTLTIDASATSVCSISGSTVSFTAAGTCVINGNQAGDANYDPAPQAQQSFAVSLASQTISFTSTAPAGATVGGPTYEVTATASSGLTVTFTIDASASTVCSIAGSTVSFIGDGTCVINANQAGDATYAPAPQEQQSFAVAKGDQTISFTSTAPVGAQVGGSTYNVTATATSGLTVTFTIDASASTVCSISGSTVSFIGVGTCVINANQAGNANYNAAPQVQQSFAVAKGDQTISFTSTAPVGAQLGGPTYNVTATATSGLTVTFAIDASAASVCSISGSTVSFIGAGTCVINANQAGDATYNPAPQVQQSFLVVKQDQTITFTSTPPAFATIGGPTYNVTATATSGLTVTFTIDASAASVCSISGSTVSFTAGGTCLINANQAGNGTYNPAPQVQQSVTVNFPPQPVASPKETFDTIGNTEFQFAAAQSVFPGVFVSGNLKDNFTDGDGPSPLAVVPISNGPTANGGTVNLLSNGEFVFTPKAGDTAASDSFGYQVTDGAYTVNRTVTINRKERVWYVKNNATAGGLGRSNDPFDTLAEAQTASLVNDYIFVYFGDGTSTGQAGGIALKGGQHLIGEFAGLTISFNPAITFNGVPATTSVPLLAQPAPTACSGNPCRPFLDDTTAGAPEGVGATDVIPIEIVGLNLAGNVNAIDWTTSGSFAGSGKLTIRDNVVRSAAVEGVDINLAGTGAFNLNLAFHDNNLTATGTALDIQETGTAGSLTITAFDDNVVSGATGGTGINVLNATFDGTPTGSFQTVSGGTTVVGATGAGNGVGGNGIVMTGVAGDLAFTDLDIFADNGAGLRITGTGAVNTGAGTGTRVTVGAGVSIIEATGGPAVDLSTMTTDLQLSSLKSTNTASKGVALANVSDGTTNSVFSAGSGSSITTTAGATGPIFDVSGGNADITYAGTITNNSASARAVSLATWSGDDGTDDITLSGAIDENGSGILVNGNTGGRPITFSGGMDIDTTTGEGFAATSNTNTLGLHITGSTNDITSISATALRVTSTTIGSSNLNFRNVSSGNNTAAADPANGIVLNATGTLGRLIVTGTGVSGQGGNATGGLVQNTTSHGIALTDTMNPSFTNMSIQSTAGSGVNGTLVASFTFDNGTINNSGTAGGTDDSNISFNDSSSSANVSGTLTLTDSVLTNSRFHGVDIQHYNGTIAHADIQNNAFTSAASIATSLGSAIRLDAYGTAAIVGNVTRATINNNVITNFPTGAGIHAFGGNSGGSGAAGTFGVAGSGTDVIAITNNLMNGGSLGVGNQPDRFFTGGVTGSGQGNFNISGNGTVASPITNIDGVVIELNQFGTGSMTATVNNNRIVANNAVGSAGINVGCDADATVALDNAVVSATISGNNVSDTDGPGIFAIARGSDCSLTARILNNTAAAPDTTTAARAGIRVDSGSAAGDTTLCLEISGNTTAGSTNTATATTSPGINLRKQGTSTTVNIFGIEGLAPSPTGTPNVENHVNSLNTSTSGTFGVNGTALLSGTSGFTSCVAP